MYWRPVTGPFTAVPGRRRTGAASVGLGPMRLLVLDQNRAEAGPALSASGWLLPGSGTLCCNARLSNTLYYIMITSIPLHIGSCLIWV